MLVMKADERLFERGKERWVIKEDEDMEEEGGGFSCFMLYFFLFFWVLSLVTAMVSLLWRLFLLFCLPNVFFASCLGLVAKWRREAFSFALIIFF